MAGPDNAHLAAMRKEYGSRERDGSPDLDVDWLDSGWLTLLRIWIGEAERAGVAEPNAMVLTTVRDGKPVSRSVLCKGVDEAPSRVMSHATSRHRMLIAISQR